MSVLGVVWAVAHARVDLVVDAVLGLSLEEGEHARVDPVLNVATCGAGEHAMLLEVVHPRLQVHPQPVTRIQPVREGGGGRGEYMYKQHVRAHQDQLGNLTTGQVELFEATLS